MSMALTGGALLSTPFILGVGAVALVVGALGGWKLGELIFKP